MKSIAILGSTGSIGTQTLDIVRRFPDRFNIISLVAHRNIQLLKDQIKKFKPEFVVVSDERNAEILSKEVDIKVLAGVDNIVWAAIDHRVDMVVISLVG
jgi:1-deoxy-D-xylulose-5-phosphate reductoisomerase